MTADEAGAMAEEILHTVTSDVMNGFDPLAKAVLADAWTRLHATLSSVLAPAELIETERRDTYSTDVPDALAPLVETVCQMADEWPASTAQHRRHLLTGAERSLRRIAERLAREIADAP